MSLDTVRKMEIPESENGCESVIWPAINCAIHFVLLLKMSFFVFASNIKNSKWIGIVLNVSFFLDAKPHAKY